MNDLKANPDIERHKWDSFSILTSIESLHWLIEFMYWIFREESLLGVDEIRIFVAAMSMDLR
jgi:hypothetical protein